MPEYAFFIIAAIVLAAAGWWLVQRINHRGARIPSRSAAAAALAAVQQTTEPAAIRSILADYLKLTAGVEVCALLHLRRGEFRWCGGTELPRRYQEQLRFEPDRRLLEVLRRPASLQPVTDIEPLLPSGVYDSIVRAGLGLYFSVAWDENVYGLCLLRGHPLLEGADTRISICGLVRSLAAAYRVEQIQARYRSLNWKLEQLEGSRNKAPRMMRPPSILKLVRHRNSDTIIPRIVESIRQDLGLDRVAYFYEHRDSASPPQAYWDDSGRTRAVPDARQYHRLAEALDGRRAVAIEVLGAEDDLLRDWLTELRRSGLSHLMLFPISGRRGGVMAWCGGGDSESVAESLDVLREHAGDLFSNALTYEKVKEMSFTDSLTGLANQRYFRKRLSEEVARAKRYDRSMALILFDLDGLKLTNDTYGHLAGDQLLMQLGEKLQSSVRSIDVVARYGGDEFCIIMPESDAAHCAMFMERFQREIATAVFFVEGREGALPCTVSIGGAVLPDHGDDPKTLIHAADMALLRAKDAGRNTAQLFG